MTLISETMNDAMNEQIGSELGASNQYLQIASYFDAENLPVLAAFFFRQSEEEREHAMKFIRYILDTGGRVEIPALDAPPHEVKSAGQAAQMAIDWETAVTGQINDLMTLARKEQDYAAEGFLAWFVEEQIEEVSTMTRLLSAIERAGDQLLLVEEYVEDMGNPHG